MKLKEKPTRRTDRRIKLDNSDIIKLLRNNSIKEIAKMFNATTWMVGIVLEEQLKLSKETYQESVKRQEEEREMDIYCTGAWMDSKERKFVKEEAISNINSNK
jgi:hypothetical protein